MYTTAYATDANCWAELAFSGQIQKEKGLVKKYTYILNPPFVDLGGGEGWGE